MFKFINCSLQKNDFVVLKNLNFKINKNTKTVILGANGAGKTSLINLCYNIEKPSFGRVETNLKQDFIKSFIFQTPVLLNSKSVVENIIFAIKNTNKKVNLNLNKNEIFELAISALQWANIEDLKNNNPKNLSVGQKQKVCLARSYAQKPEVIFLDEPSASLDPNSTLMVENLIDDLHIKGVKTITITHNMAQAERLKSDIIFVANKTAYIFNDFASFSTSEVFLNSSFKTVI